MGPTETTVPPVSTVSDHRAGVAKLLLLDAFIDHADATIARHSIVDASPSATFAAARDLDFLSVHSPLMDSAMWVRGLPARIRGTDVPPPNRMVLTQNGAFPGWSVLAQRADHEIVFGAIGVFWTPTISWHDTVIPEQFSPFDAPGWGKIACAFSVMPYGIHRSLLTYECRTLTTDDASRRRFARYWRAIRPFVGTIMGATVRTIRDDAESPAG